METLDVLTTDIDDELNIGKEVLGRLEMSHRLDDAVVERESVLG